MSDTTSYDSPSERDVDTRVSQWPEAPSHEASDDAAEVRRLRGVVTEFFAAEAHRDATAGRVAVAIDGCGAYYADYADYAATLAKALEEANAAARRLAAAREALRAIADDASPRRTT